jgi:hypothetical protein
MQCSKCGAVLPIEAKYCPTCGTPVPAQAGGITTGGGAYIGGNVTAGRDFVGRDRIEGLGGDDFAKLFQTVYGRIDAHVKADPNTDAEALRDTAKKIEQEASKGEQADPDQVRRWLGTLQKLAPDVLEVAVNALTNPAAAIASGVKLVAHAFQSISSGAEESNTG